MVTNDVFENLRNLQDILVQKYDLEKKVAEAPRQLTTQDELLARLKKEFITKDAEYKAVKEKVLSLHAELEEAIKSRESGEKGMDNITTHREYEALEKQISEATLKETDLRKELQKEEKNQAELDETLKNYEEMINSQESELNASKESLDKQIADYKAELSVLETREKEISPSLNQEILFKFQRIIQRNAQGIVAVKNMVCTGCHMILPAQFANIVREGAEGDNVMFCPYCSRILYYEESDEETPESYFNIDAAGSLADDDFDDEEDEFDDERDELDEDLESSEDMSDDDEDSLSDEGDDDSEE